MRTRKGIVFPYAFGVRGLWIHTTLTQSLRHVGDTNTPAGKWKCVVNQDSISTPCQFVRPGHTAIVLLLMRRLYRPWLVISARNLAPTHEFVSTMIVQT